MICLLVNSGFIVIVINSVCLGCAESIWLFWGAVTESSNPRLNNVNAGYPLVMSNTVIENVL